jgi:formylglycine-generating enzyme required for sulfatase activity/plastocyanin
MRRFIVTSVLLGAALVLPNCASSSAASSADGEAAIGVTGQAVSTADVVRIDVTVTGVGITTPIAYSLKKTKGQWGGVIGQIPAGANRTFHADVYDLTNAVIYTGDATGVTIGNKQTATVVLVLQQKTAPDPFHDTVPFIDSATASAASVAPGDAVSLNVAAHDVDPGDTVSYAWTSSGGAFDSATSTHPVWTAPATEGTYALTVTVRDGKGATRALSLNVDVHAANGRGSASMTASFNAWPAVTSVLATPGRVDVGQSATLATTASDPDGDALSYAWSDGGCGGSFSSASAQSPTWTAPATAPGAGTCALVVTVTDGRGGTTTGTFVEQVGAPSTVGLAPVITATAQSATSVDGGGTVVLDVAATDPEGQALTFAWSATGGTLGAAITTAGTSEITWTAPSAGTSFAVTATVTDASGLATAQVFDVRLALPPSCATPGAGRDHCGGTGEGCCTSLLVVGNASASFSRSYDGVTGGYTDPQYKAQISDFKLDKYEITVGRFRSFVDAAVGGWRPAAGAGKHTHLNGGEGLAASGGGFEPGWDAAWSALLPTGAGAKAAWDGPGQLACDPAATWTPAAGGNESRPVNCVTWHQAEAFCIWDGGFLPSEAEWNYAAAGGDEQRIYPWGATRPIGDSSLVIFGCFFNGSGICSGVSNIAPVGSAPGGDGRWGQADLGGNIAEWSLDSFASPYSETVCTNCARVAASDTTRAWRGGWWDFNDVSGLYASKRWYADPAARSRGLGLRCARVPTP